MPAALNRSCNCNPLRRFYTQLIEIPVAVLVVGTALQLWFSLGRDVLPFAAWQAMAQAAGADADGPAAHEAAAAAQAQAASGSSATEDAA